MVILDEKTNAHTETLRQAINKDPFFAFNLPEWLSHDIINDAYSQGWRPVWAKERNKQQKKGVNFLFITINPDTNKITLKNFLTKVHKIANWKCFDHTKYAFEQRGADRLNRGTGYHVHMVAKINCKPSIIRRRLLNSLTNCIGNSRHCDIQYLKDTSVSKKLNYIQGNKGEEKQSKCDQDIPWREENNISQLYVS